MTGKDIQGIIKNGEGTSVEFKLRLPRPWRLAREIAAFANTLGGTIVIGVDDKAQIVGVDSVKETIDDIEHTIGLVEPRPETSTQVISVKDSNLVILKVARGKKKPYRIVPYAPGGVAYKVYVRTGASVEPVEEGKARKLRDQDRIRKGLRLTNEQKALIAVLRLSEAMTLKKLAHRLNMSTRRITRSLVPLLKAGMVVETKTADGPKYTLNQ